ncbi:unnamed protein product [Gordionus sp. m RMFG-2023]
MLKFALKSTKNLTDACNGEDKDIYNHLDRFKENGDPPRSKKLSRQSTGGLGKLSYRADSFSYKPASKIVPGKNVRNNDTASKLENLTIIDKTSADISLISKSSRRRSGGHPSKPSYSSKDLLLNPIPSGSSRPDHSSGFKESLSDKINSNLLIKMGQPAISRHPILDDPPLLLKRNNLPYFNDVIGIESGKADDSGGSASRNGENTTTKLTQNEQFTEKRDSGYLTNGDQSSTISSNSSKRSGPAPSSYLFLKNYVHYPQNTRKGSSFRCSPASSQDDDRMNDGASAKTNNDGDDNNRSILHDHVSYSNINDDKYINELDKTDCTSIASGKTRSDFELENKNSKDSQRTSSVFSSSEDSAFPNVNQSLDAIVCEVVDGDTTLVGLECNNSDNGNVGHSSFSDYSDSSRSRNDSFYKDKSYGTLESNNGSLVDKSENSSRSNPTSRKSAAIQHHKRGNYDGYKDALISKVDTDLSANLLNNISHRYYHSAPLLLGGASVGSHADSLMMETENISDTFRCKSLCQEAEALLEQSEMAIKINDISAAIFFCANSASRARQAMDLHQAEPDCITQARVLYNKCVMNSREFQQKLIENSSLFTVNSDARSPNVAASCPEPRDTEFRYARKNEESAANSLDPDSFPKQNLTKTFASFVEISKPKNISRKIEKFEQTSSNTDNLKLYGTLPRVSLKNRNVTSHDNSPSNDHLKSNESVLDSNKSFNKKRNSLTLNINVTACPPIKNDISIEEEEKEVKQSLMHVRMSENNETSNDKYNVNKGCYHVDYRDAYDYKNLGNHINVSQVSNSPFLKKDRKIMFADKDNNATVVVTTSHSINFSTIVTEDLVGNNVNKLSSKGSHKRYSEGSKSANTHGRSNISSPSGIPNLFKNRTEITYTEDLKNRQYTSKPIYREDKNNIASQNHSNCNYYEEPNKPISNYSQSIPTSSKTTNYLTYTLASPITSSLSPQIIKYNESKCQDFRSEPKTLSKIPCLSRENLLDLKTKDHFDTNRLSSRQSFLPQTCRKSDYFYQPTIESKKEYRNASPASFSENMAISDYSNPNGTLKGIKYMDYIDSEETATSRRPRTSYNVDNTKFNSYSKSQLVLELNPNNNSLCSPSPKSPSYKKYHFLEELSRDIETGIGVMQASLSNASKSEANVRINTSFYGNTKSNKDALRNKNPNITGYANELSPRKKKQLSQTKTSYISYSPVNFDKMPINESKKCNQSRDHYSPSKHETHLQHITTSYYTDKTQSPNKFNPSHIREENEVPKHAPIPDPAKYKSYHSINDNQNYAVSISPSRLCGHSRSSHAQNLSGVTLYSNYNSYNDPPPSKPKCVNSYGRRTPNNNNNVKSSPNYFLPSPPNRNISKSISSLIPNTLLGSSSSTPTTHTKGNLQSNIPTIKEIPNPSSPAKYNYVPNTQRPVASVDSQTTTKLGVRRSEGVSRLTDKNSSHATSHDYNNKFKVSNDSSNERLNGCKNSTISYNKSFSGVINGQLSSYNPSSRTDSHQQPAQRRTEHSRQSVTACHLCRKLFNTNNNPDHIHSNFCKECQCQNYSSTTKFRKRGHDYGN